MNTSSQIYVLCKVAELARRFGVPLREAEAILKWEGGREILSFPQGTPTDPAALDRYDRMVASLGVDPESGEVAAENIDALNDKLDRALALAPRSRSI